MGGPRLDRPRARRMVRRSLARSLPPAWARCRRSSCRPASRCTALPSRWSRLRGARRTARSDCATRAVDSARRSSARTSRFASAARNSFSRTRPASEPRAITTLAAAADHVGCDLLPDDVQLDREPLDVDPAAAAFLGDWYGFAASVLEELRASARKRSRTRHASSYGRSTSILRSSWAAKPGVPAPHMACLRETNITPSRICTSRPGSHQHPAISGKRPGSQAPSSRTRNCSGCQTSATWHWHSSARACGRLSDDA